MDTLRGTRQADADTDSSLCCVLLSVMLQQLISDVSLAEFLDADSEVAEFSSVCGVKELCKVELQYFLMDLSCSAQHRQVDLINSSYSSSPPTWSLTFPTQFPLKSF